MNISVLKYIISNMGNIPEIAITNDPITIIVPIVAASDFKTFFISDFLKNKFP